MGALLDMADGTPNGMALVSSQFADVHLDLVGVAAEAANTGGEVRGNQRYGQNQTRQQYGGTGESTGGSARNF